MANKSKRTTDSTETNTTATKTSTTAAAAAAVVVVVVVLVAAALSRNQSNINNYRGRGDQTDLYHSYNIHSSDNEQNIKRYGPQTRNKSEWLPPKKNHCAANNDPKKAH